MTNQFASPVEAFFDAFRRKDVAAAMALVADNAQITVFPMRQRQAPRQLLQQLLADIAQAFPDLLISVRKITAVGKVAVAEFKLEGTQAADFLGAINQEKHLDLDTAWRFTTEAGRIVGVDAYWCQNQLYRRLAIKRQDQVAIV